MKYIMMWWDVAIDCMLAAYKWSRRARLHLALSYKKNEFEQKVVGADKPCVCSIFIVPQSRNFNTILITSSFHLRYMTYMLPNSKMYAIYIYRIYAYMHISYNIQNTISSHIYSPNLNITTSTHKDVYP